jgi:arylsulfatase A-like enzyme
MVLGFKSPHVPQTPPPRLAHRFAAATLAALPNAKAYPPYDPSPVPAALPAEKMRDYFRTLVGVDQNVGRVLAALDDAGLAADTVVVFASDNGYFLGEHGIPGAPAPGDYDGNKRNAYEESIRIPLLLRYPRLARRGVTVPATVLNIDLAPTLLDLAGLTRPASFQGRSWRPELAGRSAEPRDGFLYEYFHETSYYVPSLVALRRGGYKLIRYPRHPGWQELFRLGDDPHERRNLAADPSFRAVLRGDGRRPRRRDAGDRLPRAAWGRPAVAVTDARRAAV